MASTPTAMMTDITLDSKIPTGQWTLYFHSPKEKRWSLDSYSQITTATTWNDVFSTLNEITDAKLKGGMFFWMKAGIPPLWENHQNIRGGSYSLRGSIDTGLDVFLRYMVGCMMGMAGNETADNIVGISISPKTVDRGNQQAIGFYVIKIWNQDCSRFNKAEGLRLLESKSVLGEIMYTPHNEKKM
jgi:hypothetical protein